MLERRLSPSLSRGKGTWSSSWKRLIGKKCQKSYARIRILDMQELQDLESGKKMKNGEVG